MRYKINEIMQEDSRNATQLYSLPRLAASESPSIVRDVLLLFVLPTILMIILFASTDPTNFEYKVADPSIWGIYTSNISHRSWAHLGSNLIGFLLIGGVQYILLTASGYRYHYLALFLGALFIFPLFGHIFLQFVLVNNPVFHSYEAVGFSQPIAAMAAYLPLAIATYQSKIGRIRWPILTAVLLYAGGSAWALTQLFGFRLSTIVLGSLGLAGVIWVGLHVAQTSVLSSNDERSGYAEISLLILVVYAASVWSLFPGSNVGTMVGHLAGFLPGFLVSMGVLWGFSLLKPEHGQAINLD